VVLGVWNHRYAMPSVSFVPVLAGVFWSTGAGRSAGGPVTSALPRRAAGGGVSGPGGGGGGGGGGVGAGGRRARGGGGGGGAGGRAAGWGDVVGGRHGRGAAGSSVVREGRSRASGEDHHAGLVAGDEGWAAAAAPWVCAGAHRFREPRGGGLRRFHGPACE